MEKQCFTIVFEVDHEPATGKYRNVIVQDAANNKLYFYDSCGAYTEGTSTFIEGTSQILTWHEETRTLTISDGNTVQIPSDNTDNQTLSYDPNTNELSIENGNTVNIQTIDPVMLPYEGNFIISGGVITPGVGLQANVSQIEYASDGARLSTGPIPTEVLQPSKDTYLVLNRSNGVVDQIVIDFSDAPPLLPEGREWIGWIRTNATNVTNTNDIRLMRYRGYAMRFEVSNTFTIGSQAFTRIPYNTVGNDGYRFGSPFRSDGSSPGVHRIPVTGMYSVHAMIRMGTWGGTYRCMLTVYLNGNSIAPMNAESVSGNRSNSGSAAGEQNTIQRMAGSTEVYCQEGDLLEVRVWHSVPGTRTFGQDGRMQLNLIGS